jgi:hypothetical protein
MEPGDSLLRLRPSNSIASFRGFFGEQFDHFWANGIGDCVVRAGDWVLGDIDGVVVVPAEAAETVFVRGLEKVTGENRVREELARGRSIREVFAEYRIL